MSKSVKSCNMTVVKRSLLQDKLDIKKSCVKLHKRAQAVFLCVHALRMQPRMNVLYKKEQPKEDLKHKTRRSGCMLTCLRGMVGTHGMEQGGISGAWVPGMSGAWVPGMSWVSRVHAWRWAVRRWAMWRWSVMSSCILLRSCLLLHLLTSFHLSVLQLLHVERLSLCQKLLPLELQL